MPAFRVINKRDVIQEDYSIHGHTLNIADNLASRNRSIEQAVKQIPHAFPPREICEYAQEVWQVMDQPHWKRFVIIRQLLPIIKKIAIDYCFWMEYHLS